MVAAKSSKSGRARRDKSALQGIKSAGVGAAVLATLSAQQAALPLREVARRSGLSPSNAYRYLVSFVQSGLVAQNADGRYDLGPAAIELGLAALARIDGLAIAYRTLAALTEATGLDGHVSVMGSAGPTVVRWHGRPREVSLRVNEGTVLPLLLSATGRLFAVHLPAARIEPMLAEEIERFAGELGIRPKELRSRFEAARAEILRDGFSRAAEERRRGIDAIAAPIMGPNGEIAMSFTLIGFHGGFDLAADGEPARQLLSAAATVSRQLGFRDL